MKAISVKKILSRHETILFIILIALAIAGEILNPAFLSQANVFKTLNSSVEMGIFALAFLVLLILGGIDMSFPAIASASMYITIKLLLPIDGDIPLILFDPVRFSEVLELLTNLTRDNSCSPSFEIMLKRGEVSIVMRSDGNMLDYRLFLNDASYLLAEKIMVMHQGLMTPSHGSVTLSFPLPTFSSLQAKDVSGKIITLGGDLGPSSYYDDVFEIDKSLAQVTILSC